MRSPGITDEVRPDFPQPIVHVVRALSDSERRGILIRLKREPELSWKRLLEQGDMKKGTLNHHLNVLEESGLIRNFSKGSPLEPYHSFYELTPLAERTIEALFGAFSPQRPQT